MLHSQGEGEGVGGAAANHGQVHDVPGVRASRFLLLEGQVQSRVASPGGTADLHPDAAARLPSGVGQEGARAPLSDEILTWPRVLGSGCVALLVVLPTAGFLVVLLTTAALR